MQQCVIFPCCAHSSALDAVKESHTFWLQSCDCDFKAPFNSTNRKVWSIVYLFAFCSIFFLSQVLHRMLPSTSLDAVLTEGVNNHTQHSHLPSFHQYRTYLWGLGSVIDSPPECPCNTPLKWKHFVVPLKRMLSLNWYVHQMAGRTLDSPTTDHWWRATTYSVRWIPIVQAVDVGFQLFLFFFYCVFCSLFTAPNQRGCCP